MTHILRCEGDWIVCHVPLLSEKTAVYANVWYPEGYKGEKLGEPIAAKEVDVIGSVTSEDVMEERGNGRW